MKIDTLNNLNLEETGYIIKNNIKNKNRKQLTNLGITKNTKIKYLYKSPFNDPKAYLIKNIILAIREEDAKNIIILRKKNGIY